MYILICIYIWNSLQPLDIVAQGSPVRGWWTDMSSLWPYAVPHGDLVVAMLTLSKACAFMQSCLLQVLSCLLQRYGLIKVLLALIRIRIAIIKGSTLARRFLRCSHT